jgi:hypothetical protein
MVLSSVDQTFLKVDFLQYILRIFSHPLGAANKYSGHQYEKYMAQFSYL